MIRVVNMAFRWFGWLPHEEAQSTGSKKKGVGRSWNMFLCAFATRLNKADP